MAVASINTNVHSQYAAKNIRAALESSKTSTIRISGGDHITSASDDAAGLSIGSGLATDKSTLQANSKIASQAISILSIADGGLNELGKIMARMKSLASQANSGAMGTPELGYIKQEMDALIAQVDTIVATTKFNGQKLLDGTFTAKAFQIGLTTTDTISISLSQADAAAAGLNISGVDVTSSIAAANTSIDTAIGSLKTMRAGVGALQSRFQFAFNNIETSSQNVDAARADYLDADIARESTSLAKDQVKLQAGVAVLSQVNQLPANLLKLLG
jgi:flagellin